MSQLNDASHRLVRFSSYTLDLQKRELLEHGKAVDLGGRAYDLLLALIESNGKVISNEELMNSVWPGRVVEDNSLHAHMSALRKAFGDNRSMIRTVSGRGYQFTADLIHGDALSSVMSVQMPTPTHVLTNLPERVSDLIGREHAVREAAQLVAAHRLLTLVGTGGIGKTRLGLEVARELSPRFSDGVWLAELGPMSDPELVPALVALALGVLPASGTVSGESVALAVKDRSLLLILDNCEHLVDAAARMAEALLRGCAHISIIATSREPLLAEAEYVYRVPPLEVPEDAALATESAYAGSVSGAMALFMARVQAAEPGFVADSRFMALATTVCRSLDGIPLAIELAAVRCSALGIEALAARLDDRLKLLSGGRRTALPRHQTLLATFDWSFDLLPPAERVVFRRLGVFAGNFSLAAASAVVADDTLNSDGGNNADRSGVCRADVSDHIAQLVGKSLLGMVSVAVAGQGTVAYRLLETTRAYALQRLLVTDEFERCAAAHAAYYLGVLENAQAEFENLPPSGWQTISGRDIDNVRTALAWAYSPQGSTDAAEALTVAAVPLWIHLSLVNECRIRVQQALSTGRAVHPGESKRDPARDMRLLAALGSALFYISMGPDARAAWTRALELARELGDDDYQLRALWGLWVDRLNCGEFRESLRVAERFLAVAESASESNDFRLGHRLIGISQHFLGDQIRAGEHLARMVGNDIAPPNLSHMIRFQFDPWVTARVFQARIRWLRGFPDEAARIVATTVEQALELKHTLSLVNALGQGACLVSLLNGDVGAAHQYAALMEAHCTRQGITLWQAWGRCFSAAVLVKQGDVAEGLRLMQAEFTGDAASVSLPRYMVLVGELASALGSSGQHPQALAVINEALARAERQEERWYLPELMCAKARILLSAGGPRANDTAETCLLQAIACSQQQEALSFELRATTAWARLCASLGRRQQARAALLVVFQRFTEGFGTADLMDAGSLLDQLAAA